MMRIGMEGVMKYWKWLWIALVLLLGCDRYETRNPNDEISHLPDSELEDGTISASKEQANTEEKSDDYYMGCAKPEARKEASRSWFGSTSQASNVVMAESVQNMPVMARAPMAEPEAPIEWNTAEFSQYDANRFMNTLASPLSTFGADVDTASYAIFRRSVNQGKVPEKQDLRVEEMINYFHYDYPEPKSGEPFSVTMEIAPCPWNEKTKLMMVGAQTHTLKKDEIPKSNLVFLLDSSGSMYNKDKLPLLKKALLMLTRELGAEDRVSIVTYAGDSRVVLEGAKANDRARIGEALRTICPGGGTNGEGGIQMAYQMAQKHFIQGGNNRIILGTDGDLNVGISSTNELKALVEEKRKSGVFLSVLGFGFNNLKDNRMEALADNGNGSYHYIDSVAEARKVLVREMQQTMYVAAKDVKFQVEFNPAKVKGYRLIGYETRALKAEDFADDTKDGGEVGAGHQVTMLYEIVETGSDFAVPEVTTKYQQTVVSDSHDFATVNVRYKAPDGDTSQLLSYAVTPAHSREKASENLNFASAVAQIAMILNQSEHKGTATYDSVLEQLKGVSVLDADEDRAEFVTMVRKLKNL